LINVILMEDRAPAAQGGFMQAARHQQIHQPSPLMSHRASDLSYPVRMTRTAPAGDDTPRQRFASTVRAARIQRGWRQDQLATAAGVSEPTIQRWETGKTGTPDPENARKVFTALGLDPRLIPVLLGYVTAEEMDLPPEPPRVFNPTVEEVIRILEDPQVPAAAKAEWVEFLRFRAQPPAETDAHRQAG
jgi:transcriptional regulator with XRE-family HTH domain